MRRLSIFLIAVAAVSCTQALKLTKDDSPAVLSHQLGQHLAKELMTYLPKKAA